MAEENKNGISGVPELPGAEELAIEEPEARKQRGWWEIFRQAFDKARREQRAISKLGTLKKLQRKGKDLEKRVLASALRWHLEDRVVVHENRTIVFWPG